MIESAVIRLRFNLQAGSNLTSPSRKTRGTFPPSLHRLQFVLFSLFSPCSAHQHLLPRTIFSTAAPELGLCVLIFQQLFSFVPRLEIVYVIFWRSALHWISPLCYPHIFQFHDTYDIDFEIWNLPQQGAVGWKRWLRRGSCPPSLYLTIWPNAAKITNTFTQTQTLF